MIVEATEQFELVHPQGQAAALAFVRDPALALSQVRFLRGLRTTPAQGAADQLPEVSGELVLAVPVIGEVDLPFCSRVQATDDGAALEPQPRSGERAWVAVSGRATVGRSGQMQFHFDFAAHLTLPEAEGWGGAAFEKMVRAAAGRTLARVGQALPAGIQAALPST